jgi:hypothetical protein
VRDRRAARLSDAPHILHSALCSFPRSFEHVGNPLENLVDPRNHFVVPEPQHPVAGRAQKLGPNFVAIRLIGVLRTIQFNNELGFLTKEVREIWPNRMLAAELEVGQLVVA